jgi:hypothetical protein
MQDGTLDSQTTCRELAKVRLETGSLSSWLARGPRPDDNGWKIGPVARRVAGLASGRRSDYQIDGPPRRIADDCRVALPASIPWAAPVLRPDAGRTGCLLALPIKLLP